MELIVFSFKVRKLTSPLYLIQKVQNAKFDIKFKLLIQCITLFKSLFVKFLLFDN